MVKKETRTVFITSDGKEFPDEDRARLHELASAISETDGIEAEFGCVFVTRSQAEVIAKHLLQSFQITANELRDTQTLPINFAD